jgi:hypothetical protein
MILKNRVPAIDNRRPTERASGFHHLDEGAIALLRWLSENRIDFVLVGAVARQIRGEHGASGPVAIVCAPYGRNLDRLARALTAARAQARGEGAGDGASEAPLKLDAQKLLGPRRWVLRCGRYELDVEGHPPGGPRYQELLYEAARFELAEGLSVEVASPEDIEHYEQMARTGEPPRFHVSRAER